MARLAAARCCSALVVAICALQSPLALGYESCPNQCAVPPPTTFCTPMNYAVCQLSSFSAQEMQAQQRFAAMTNVTGRKLSSSCMSTLRHFVCMEAFPACEIAQEMKRLCSDQCDVVKGVCAPLTDAEFAQLCSPKFMSDSQTCFKLSYTGPNVGLWLAGFLISVIFSFLAALGINLQKYSLRRNDAAAQPRPPYKQPYWMMGFTLIVLGSILDFVAFGLAPQTFLAPLAALSLVWNMLLAPKFHKDEKITRQNVVSTIVIAVGVTSTVIFSAHATPTYVLDDLIFLAEQPVMIWYVAFVVGMLVTMYAGTKYIERTGREGSIPHIVCYGGMGGTFGGQSVLLAKSVVELVKSALFGEGHAFSSPPTYFLALGMACCLVAQLHFLNEGLRRFDALLMVPTYQAFWIMMSIFGGLMFFEEYQDFTAVDYAMFFFGTCVTMSGIGLLLRGRPSGRQDTGDGGGAGSAAAGGAGGAGGLPRYSELRRVDSAEEDDEAEPASLSDMSAAIRSKRDSVRAPRVGDVEEGLDGGGMLASDDDGDDDGDDDDDGEDGGPTFGEDVDGTAPAVGVAEQQGRGPLHVRLHHDTRRFAPAAASAMRPAAPVGSLGSLVSDTGGSRTARKRTSSGSAEDEDL